MIALVITLIAIGLLVWAATGEIVVAVFIVGITVVGLGILGADDADGKPFDCWPWRDR